MARGHAILCRRDIARVAMALRVEFGGQDHPLGRELERVQAALVKRLVRLINAGRKDGLIPPGSPPRRLRSHSSARWKGLSSRSPDKHRTTSTWPHARSPAFSGSIVRRPPPSDRADHGNPTDHPRPSLKTRERAQTACDCLEPFVRNTATWEPRRERRRAPADYRATSGQVPRYRPQFPDPRPRTWAIAEVVLSPWKSSTTVRAHRQTLRRNRRPSASRARPKRALGQRRAWLALVYAKRPPY
jgi:hypothetical protein